MSSFCIADFGLFVLKLEPRKIFTSGLPNICIYFMSFYQKNSSNLRNIRREWQSCQRVPSLEASVLSISKEFLHSQFSIHRLQEKNGRLFQGIQGRVFWLKESIKKITKLCPKNLFIFCLRWTPLKISFSKLPILNDLWGVFKRCPKNFLHPFQMIRWFLTVLQ